MSNADRLPQPILAEPAFYRPQPPQRASLSRKAQLHAPIAPAPLPPLVEQALLFGFFAGGAAFWMAVIWWILR